MPQWYDQCPNELVEVAMIPDFSPAGDLAAEAMEMSAVGRRNIGIAKRREAPRFIICDASMRVLFATAGLDHAALFKDGLESIQPMCRETILTKTTVFHSYDDDTILRIVALDGQQFACVAIVVDSFGRRGSIFKAAKQFGLTKRESEVLQMLIKGKANSEVAERLCVAESTVADHVKSIMRKAGTSKRGALVSKVFDLEQDIAAENDG
jgi:DNA-binding CsgD family transcriptional regulator